MATHHPHHPSHHPGHHHPGHHVPHPHHPSHHPGHHHPSHHVPHVHGHPVGRHGHPHQVHHGGHGHHHVHDPAILRNAATLQAFDSTNYLATIQLLRSPDQTIAAVPVSRAIPSANMVLGKALAVMFFDHHNSADAMVVGVY